jgi:large subunit ribosomal protein L24
MAAKLKKGDKVVVIAGKDKGKKGQISRVLPAEGKAVVSGVNVAVRHSKQTAQGQGGRIARELPIQLSNLALVDPKSGEATRVGFRIEKGEKVRYAKKSGETLNG